MNPLHPGPIHLGRGREFVAREVVRGSDILRALWVLRMFCGSEGIGVCSLCGVVYSLLLTDHDIAIGNERKVRLDNVVLEGLRVILLDVLEVSHL